MKKIALLLALVSSCALQSFAQKGKPIAPARSSMSALNSNVGLGFRATPDGGGITGKFFVSNNLAIEAQINAGGVLGWVDGTSFNVVGLAEYHIVLPDPSWRIFFGGGLHFGAWDRGLYYSESRSKWVDGNQPIFGIDAVGGVEYAFKKIPLGLSADIKPAVNFASDVAFFPHNMVGIAARYYF